MNPTDLKPEQWEKKSELSMQENDIFEAIKYSNYAVLAEMGVDSLDESDFETQSELRENL